MAAGRPAVGCGVPQLRRPADPHHGAAAGSCRVWADRDAAGADQFRRLLGLCRVRADLRPPGRLDASLAPDRGRSHVLGHCDRDGVAVDGLHHADRGARSRCGGRGDLLSDCSGIDQRLASQRDPQPRAGDSSDRSVCRRRCGRGHGGRARRCLRLALAVPDLRNYCSGLLRRAVHVAARSACSAIAQRSGFRCWQQRAIANCPTETGGSDAVPRLLPRQRCGLRHHRLGADLPA